MAEWKTRGGKYWISLWRCSSGDGCYGYSSDNGGGSFQAESDDAAVANIEQRFIGPSRQTDKINMKLVYRAAEVERSPS